MTRRSRVLLAGAAACGVLFVVVSPWMRAPSSEVDGVWLVRFEETEGVLGLREGRVYAHCYGETVKLGTFSLDDGVLELHVRFHRRIPRPVEYTGAITKAGETFADGFDMDRGPELPWLFRPYTGDCSERATRARRKIDRSGESRE